VINKNAELLFPWRVIRELRDIRGAQWQKLVERISFQPPTALDSLGFVLLMVRLGGCHACSADSYRALRGCKACAQQTLRRFSGSDEDLLRLFRQARQEVDDYWDTIG